MPVLKNARHERFAQAVASGLTQADAYRKVFPSSKRWQDSSVHQAASKINAKVLPRVAELLQSKADDGIASREELSRFLTDVVRTPVGTVAESSPLAQEVEVRSCGEEVLSTKVRMPSKLDAVDKLAKLRGYYAPEKVDNVFRFEPDAKVMEILRD